MAYVPSTQEIWATNTPYGTTIAHISDALNAVTTYANFGNQSYFVDTDPANGYTYVGVWSTSLLAVFVGDQRIGTIDLGGVATVSGITNDPWNGDVLVDGGDSCNVTVVHDLTVVTTVPTWKQGCPSGVYMDPARNEAIAADYPSKNGIRIDGVSFADEGTVPNLGAPGQAQVAYDPKNGMLYLPDGGVSGLRIVNGNTLATVGTISLGTAPGGAIWDPVSGYVFVTLPNSNLFEVVDPATNTVLASTHTASDPTFIALDPHNGMAYTADYNGGSVSAICLGHSVYNVTFNEVGLASGTSWAVNLSGIVKSATTSSITIQVCGNGLRSYAVRPVLGYTANPGGGSVNVNGADVSVTITFSGARQAFAYSQFIGDIATGLPFQDTFGFYSAFGPYTPNSTWALAGSYNFSLNGSSTPGGPYNLTINVGALSPTTSTITFYGAYGGFILSAPYSLQSGSQNIQLVSTPSWLATLLSGLYSITVTPSTQLEWNNSYTLSTATRIPIAADFTRDISLPLTGGGNDSWVPSFDFNFALQSTGSASLTGGFTLTSPKVTMAGFDVQVTASVAMVGTISVDPGTESIQWSSSTLTVQVGGDFSVTFPIVGFTVGIGGAQYTIGLVAELDVAPSFSVSFVVTPSSTNPTFPGIDLQFSLQSAQLALPITADVKAALADFASVTGGGTVEVDMTFNPSPPYISGVSVTGTVFVKACVWTLCAGYSYSASGGFMPDWPSAFIGPAFKNFTNFSYLPRYYNISGYDRVAWVTGSFAGNLVQDAYPYASFSSGSTGTRTYTAYTFDNVSRPESRSPVMAGFMFNPVTRQLSRWTAPNDPGMIQVNPGVYALPNGTVLLVWDALLPRSVNLTDPFAVTREYLQFAYYHPSGGTWTRPGNWTSWGFPLTTSENNSRANSRLLALVGSGPLATQDSLLEYNVSTRAIIANQSVANVQGIDGFDARSSLAILRTAGGVDALFNESSGLYVSLPSVAGLTLERVRLGSSSLLALYYMSNTSGQVQFYNLTTGTTVATVHVGPTVLQDQFLCPTSSCFLVVANGTGVRTYWLMPNGTVDLLASNPVSNLTGMTVTYAPSGSLLVDAVRTTGNGTMPWVNLTRTVESTVPPPAPTLTLTPLSALNFTVSWNLPNANGYGVVGYRLLAGATSSSLNVSRTFNSSTVSFTLRLPYQNEYYLAVQAVNAFGGGAASNTVFLYSVIFRSSALPFNTTWTVKVGTTTLSATGPIVGFNVAAGSYSYTVTSPVAGSTGVQFLASPTSGTVQATSGTVASVTISFTTQYRLTMVASPSNGGSVTPASGWKSIGAQVAISATPSSGFAFTGWQGVGNGSYTGNTSSTTVTMNGPVNETAGFASAYAVKFTESGLKSKTSWSVTLNGVKLTSTTTTITFNEPNGTYSFTVGQVSGKTANPSSGQVTVNGAMVGVNITFSDRRIPRGASREVLKDATVSPAPR